MKELNRREKILLIIMAIALVIFIYFKYFLNPVLDKITAAKSNIIKYNSEISNIELTKEMYTKQSTDIQGLKDKLAEAEQAVPSSERNPEISYNLKPLIDKNNVVLNSVNFGDAFEYMGDAKENNSKQSKDNTQSAVNLMAVPVNIGLSGDYENIVDFIAAVEKDKRIAEVYSVNISAAKDGKLEASIGINYFYIAADNMNGEQYDFNNGSYGKTDLFK